ncbi:histidine kinase N-terminal 7TM domain-containing protein [Paractinoplanes ferrugineus]|uniref:GGDEF domain-containing protein n=1 Tax=Paractinoplanes ferrugineus TaxID=113564 RepID=A0A919IVI1_9ACTN|nr:diguanylate cyclase [Actinoplanes ferrugineus]GIE09806.1 GGDEF domain-containing protein [Actinoplanes ferrugineus]
MARVALSALFAVAIIIAATLTVMAWQRRRESAGFTAIAALAGGATWWSLCTTVPLFSHDRTLVMVANSLLYPGVFLVVAGWWATARALTNRFWRLDRRSLLLLSIEPALCTIAILTNPWHHLFIDHLRPTVIDGAWAAVFGPLFWLHTIYSYVLVLYSAVSIFRTYVRQTGRYRGYLVAVLAILPAVLINVGGILAGGHIIDVTACGFALSAPTMYWVTHRSTPSLAPVVHREVFQNMMDPVVVLGPNGNLVEANPAATALLARLGVPAADLGRLLADVPTRFGGDHVLRDVRGSGLDFSVRVSLLLGPRGEYAGAILVAHDITEQLRVNEQLRAQLTTIEALRASLAEQAARDYLTGLYNRRHLMDELSKALDRGTGFTFVLLDIDFFKQINDRHGHNAGDDVLVHLATRLAGSLRPGDVAARYGGEEFALLLHGVAGAEAAAWMDGVRAAVAAEPIDVDGVPIAVSFSAGVADSAGHQCPIALIADADQALYSAKANGRNRVEPASGRGRLAPAG